jgi:hypothetical protein
MLLIDETSEHSEFASLPISCGRYTRWSPPQWRHVADRVEPWRLAVALQNSQTRLAPRAMARVRHLVIDIDVHEEPPRAAWTDADLDFAMTSRPTAAATRAANRRNRQWRAEKARPVVAQLDALGLADVVEWSPQGWHVVVLLAEPLAATEAARLAQAIVARLRDVPEDVAVESFPKLRTDGRADHCSLPLTGAQRRCGLDLVTAVGTRTEAVDDLLCLDGHLLDELRALLGDLPAAPPPPIDARSRLDNPAPADGQLFGSAFVVHVLGLLARGIGQGESYDSVRRVYAASRYVGHDHEQAREIVREWLDVPIHRARHTETAAGRRELLRLVAAQGRYFEHGRIAGRCYENGLRSSELRAAFAALLQARHDAAEEFSPCDTRRPPTANTPKTRRVDAGAQTAPSSSSASVPKRFPIFGGSSSAAGSTRSASGEARSACRHTTSRTASRRSSTRWCGTGRTEAEATSPAGQAEPVAASLGRGAGNSAETRRLAWPESSRRDDWIAHTPENEPSRRAPEREQHPILGAPG